MKKIWYAPYKFESYGEEEIKAVENTLRSGWLGGQGPKSIKFEREIAKRFGKKYGVFVNSGSSACLLAIAALDLPVGSKIVTPACTFSTTLAPIIQLGYKPVFCDVDLTLGERNFELKQKIFSSGLGGIFPKGIEIGSIYEIQDLSPKEVRLVIELNADPLSSNYFGVIQK